MLKTVAIAAGILALTACTTMENGTDVADEIAASTAQFRAAYNSGDAAALAALYTMDAAVLPPDVARIDGREGIQEMWQGFMDAGVTDLDLATVELEAGKGTASEVGTYSLKAPDGQGGTVTVTGKFIVLWQKGEDGVWRLHRDIWNDNPAG